MSRLVFGTWVHLSRRLWGTWRSQPLNDDELTWVRKFLLDDELNLWRTMAEPDQRHAFQVARRFVAAAQQSLEPQHDQVWREMVAAALLHDVGKTVSNLSTLERVALSIVGGRTRRFRSYLEHEEIGLDLCRKAGSSLATLQFLEGSGDRRIQELLQQADDI
jgi:phage tail sheath protein FI